jgi:predicted DNA-binding protein (MmcQ/YjbR family)
MNTSEAVRAICLSFPEAEEKLSHGSPEFHVRGKSFASYLIHHHGDGRVALWLPASPGAQEHYCESEPKHFFVPPYVGPRGWLGVHLDKGLDFKRVAELVREAYVRVAPPQLAAKIGKTIVLRGPIRPLSAVERDPLQGKRAQAVLRATRKLCLALPETCEDTQFGSPCFRAGKKAFALVHASADRVKLQFWVGAAGQAMATTDPRYEVPPYSGHNGWIALDVTKKLDTDETGALARTSYRHFANKRMLKALE